MELKDASVQEIQLELIRRSSWNLFDGEQIFADLHQYKDLWEAVMLDRDEPLQFLKLSRLPENKWSADQLFLLARDEASAQKLVELCLERWRADSSAYH